MKSQKKEESLIHVRFEYNEAIQAKRDILFSQISALRIEKSIKSYSFYRLKEIELKMILHKKMKELRITISRLEKALPKLEIPEIIERKDSSKKEVSEPKEITQSSSDIESQLKTIQRRLDQLQRNSMDL